MLKSVNLASRRSAALLVTTVLFVTACGGSTPTASPKTPTSAPSAAASAAASPTSAAPSAQGTTPAGSPAATATPFSATPGDVTLVAYSTPKAAYDAIIPLFQATADGSGVNFEESY